MTTETLTWTLILFGGTVLAVVWLSAVAWRKETAQLNDGDGADTASLT